MAVTCWAVFCMFRAEANAVAEQRDTATRAHTRTACLHTFNTSRGGSHTVVSRAPPALHKSNIAPSCAPSSVLSVLNCVSSNRRTNRQQRIIRRQCHIVVTPHNPAAMSHVHFAPISTTPLARMVACWFLLLVPLALSQCRPL